MEEDGGVAGWGGQDRGDSNNQRHLQSDTSVNMTLQTRSQLPHSNFSFGDCTGDILLYPLCTVS